MLSQSQRKTRDIPLELKTDMGVRLLPEIGRSPSAAGPSDPPQEEYQDMEEPRRLVGGKRTIHETETKVADISDSANLLRFGKRAFMNEQDPDETKLEVMEFEKRQALWAAIEE